MPDILLNEKEAEKLNTVSQVLKRKITNGEAAKKLGLSVRQIQRLKIKVRKIGPPAIPHHLKGKPSNHRFQSNIKLEALNLIKENYSDFKPGFASEKLGENHRLVINPETLRLWMIEENLWKVKRHKHPEYRAWRERKEYFGELEQFDGSYHLWFEDRLLNSNGYPVEICLLASIDDATGKITQAKFELNEGVIPVFNFWKEYVLTFGKPLTIYLDKFSTYKINHKLAVDNTELMTQLQKAMRILDIKLINANSPQAKGRVERLFGTLQDRLVKELRLAGINSIENGNRFLKEIFIPKFNTKFSVVAKRDGNTHRLLTSNEKLGLKSIFSLKHIRSINQDFTIQFKNHFYQLEEIQPITIRAKNKVLVEERLNNTLRFRFKNKYLKVFSLSQKPKQVSYLPTILTSHPLIWKPPANHPWRLQNNALFKRFRG